MNAPDKSYGLLSQTSDIRETMNEKWQRHLPLSAGFAWLGAGWRDLKFRAGPSLVYGLGIFIVSAAFVWFLVISGRDYILFPALAGFMIVAPLLAIGLYEKSRAIGENEPVSLKRMLFVKPRAGAQVFITGLVLCLLMLLWMRAAVLLYALFFGLRPFPGFDHLVETLFTSPTGWALLAIGTVVGGLFASFTFAISAFSVPMLLNERVDAFTVMGTSMALVWNNLPVMLLWGVIVLALFAASVATGLLGLIVIFPLLGHGTWHAYCAMRHPKNTS